MGLESLLLNTQLARWILNLGFQSSVVLVIGWLIFKIMKRKGAPIRSGIILMTLGALIILPLLNFALYSLNFISYQTSLPYYWNNNIKFFDNNNPNNVAADSAIETDPVLFTTEKKEKKLSDKQSLLLSSPKSIINSLGIVWFGISIVLFIRLIYGGLSISRFRRDLIKIDYVVTGKMFGAMKQKFRNKKIPDIFTSRSIKSPVALGFLKPIIVIPHDLYSILNDTEIKFILLHEASHIINRDQLTGFLQRIVIVLFWWNPLAYRLSRELSISREEISDNYAIMGSNSVKYTECLIDLAERILLVSHLPGSIGMASSQFPLKARIKNILSKERNMDTKLSKPLFVLLILGTFLLSALVGAHNFTFSTKIVELPNIIDPTSFQVDGDRLYISEITGISVIKLKDFNTIKVFGRKGEGPGEWIWKPYMTVYPDFLLVNSAGKLMFFSKDGALIKEIKHATRDKEFLPIGLNFIGYEYEYKDNQIQKKTINLYNENLKFIKKICDQPTSDRLSPRDRSVMIFHHPAHNKGYYRVYKDRLYISDTNKGFYIGVYNKFGEKLYEINKEYEKIKVTEEYKRNRTEEIKIAWQRRVNKPKYKIIFREYFPPPYRFYVNSEKIFVYTEKREYGLNEILIMDLKGEIQKRVYVPDGEGYFANNRFFCIRENVDKEVMELHVVEF